jgi:hypothetical protein
MIFLRKAERLSGLLTHASRLPELKPTKLVFVVPDNSNRVATEFRNDPQ